MPVPSPYVTKININAKGNLLFESAVNGNPHYYYKSFPIPKDEWTTIEVSQKASPNINMYLFTIKINRAVVHNVVNRDAQEFQNVTIYSKMTYSSSSSSSLANTVEVKNVRLRTNEESRSYNLPSTNTTNPATCSAPGCPKTIL